MLHKKITMVNDCNPEWEEINSLKNTNSKSPAFMILGSHKENPEKTSLSVDKKKAL